MVRSPPPSRTRGEDDIGLARERRLLLLGRAVGVIERLVEARIGFERELLDALGPVIADESGLGPVAHGNHGRGERNHARPAEHHHSHPLEVEREFFAERLLGASDHGGSGGEGAGGIGEYRDLEGRHHRLLGAVHHVERFDGALAADEHCGALDAFGTAREDCILHEAVDILDGHVGIGDRVVEACVEGHIHVERAHVLERREHV